MTITFEPLAKSDFPLLLKWLKTPHVKAWWDQEVNWTSELIWEKYKSYVEGYKIDKGIPKKIAAYLIQIEEVPVGYVQIYNAYDFPRARPLRGLPEKLAAFDILIGEQNYLRQGIGALTLQQFFQAFCNKEYTHIFADPHINNIAAIKTYAKVGFKRVQDHEDTEEVWMLREQSPIFELYGKKQYEFPNKIH